MARKKNEKSSLGQRVKAGRAKPPVTFLAGRASRYNSAATAGTETLNA